MDIKEFLSVRRAYGIVRQKTPADERLTFEEFAILCRLALADEPLKTSAIAEYQGALRPTMTHRTNHLFELGLIERGEGAVDRRNVVCSISEKGLDCAERLSELTCAQISTGRALSRTSSERIRKYVDAMGALYVKAGDMVLLGIFVSEGQELTIMQIVDALGLLQPTVSMSVRALEEAGLVCRSVATETSHTTKIGLTDAGRKQAEEVAALVDALVVRRKERKAK